MKRIVLFSAAMMFALFTLRGTASAQEDETPKVELGVQFSSLSFSRVNFGDSRTEAGFGGRITYNITDNVAVEAEGNFFPKREFSTSTAQGGRALQGLFGVKAGKRFRRFGVFGKARPGFVRFSRTIDEINVESVDVEGQQFFVPSLTFSDKTHFALDVGGVVEIYHTRRIATRFDLGDTIIRYGERPGAFFVGLPGAVPTFITQPATSTHNFQFNAGVSFRF